MLENRGILPAHERAERLLRFLVDRTDTVGTGVDVNWTTLAAFCMVGVSRFGKR